MSLFRFLRSFPEYADADSYLDKAITANAKALSRYDVAHGPHFTEFARRHPDSVSEVLFKIERDLAGVRECYRASNESLGTARRELAALSPLHENIVRQRKDTEQATHRWEKSVQAQESARKKLDNATASGDALSMAKAQAQLDAAQHQVEFDGSLKDSKVAALEAAEKNYQEETFGIILAVLKKLSSIRIDAAERLAAVGPAVAQHGREIPLMDDPSLGKIQSEIQSLQAELEQLEQDKQSNAT
jgi:ATPase subunit of ABC transporter with duplicated ATPase domains